MSAGASEFATLRTDLVPDLVGALLEHAVKATVTVQFPTGTVIASPDRRNARLGGTVRLDRIEVEIGAAISRARLFGTATGASRQHIWLLADEQSAELLDAVDTAAGDAL